MVINNNSIGVYFRLNHHSILMAIGGYYINNYCWLVYCKPLVVIDGYSIGGCY